MRLLILLIVAMSLLACGKDETIFHTSTPPKPPEKAEIDSLIHSSKGWTHKVIIKLATSAPERIALAIVAVTNTWNNAIGREIIVYGGTINSTRGNTIYASLSDDDNVIYYEPEWDKTVGKDSSTLASTVWANSPVNKNEIDKADIIINASIYAFQDSTQPRVEDNGKYIVDTETILLHEVGHLLGLGHSTEVSSVMVPQAQIGFGRYHRILSDGDIATIRKIYH